MKFDNRDIKVVWLDLDDTIIDFETNSRRALHRLWAEETAINRHFATASEWIDTYELHNHKLWDLYGRGKIDRTYLRMERFLRPLTQGGIAETEASSLSARYDTLYLDFLAQEKELIPDSIALLKHLRESGLKIGCLSNGFKDVQYRKIRNCGLEPWFDIVVLSDDIGINKPDRRLFEHAATVSGHPESGRHLMIGDNPTTDIAGALNAGWSAIQFLRHEESPRNPSCRYFASNLSTVIHLIK